MQQLLTPSPRLSLVIPVYNNQEAIADLLAAVRAISGGVDHAFEAVLVVDGSPDMSMALLQDHLPGAGFNARLVALSRNFGAFSAIRVGLELARGQVIAVMAADLQEPPELALKFLRTLEEEGADVAFGIREGRDDPFLSKMMSQAFWGIYRRFVMRDIPRGGVDVFAVTARFRDRLLLMRESNTSLLAQLFWLGGRRVFVPYVRRSRQHGKSGWTLAKKFRYLSDSIFAFTDLPVRILTMLGAVALLVSLLLGCVVLFARISGIVEVPGYAGTMLTILFFGALNALGLGVVGTYAWRGFENTKSRPLAVIQSEQVFEGNATK